MRLCVHENYQSRTYSHAIIEPADVSASSSTSFADMQLSKGLVLLGMLVIAITEVQKKMRVQKATIAALHVEIGCAV
jgi:hypothetical protein